MQKSSDLKVMQSTFYHL